GGREDEHDDGLQDDGHEQDGTPPHVVRERPDGQQGGEHGEGVHAEYDGRGDGGEAPLGLVDGVEWGWRTGRGEEEHYDRHQEIEGYGGREPTGAGRSRGAGSRGGDGWHGT